MVPLFILGEKGGTMAPFPIPYSQKALSLWKHFKSDLLPRELL